eukprot:357753-Chlamydomonas_euryale.AAC.4
MVPRYGTRHDAGACKHGPTIATLVPCAVALHTHRSVWTWADLSHTATPSPRLRLCRGVPPTLSLWKRRRNLPHRHTSPTTAPVPMRATYAHTAEEKAESRQPRPGHER